MKAGLGGVTTVSPSNSPLGNTERHLVAISAPIASELFRRDHQRPVAVQKPAHRLRRQQSPNGRCGRCMLFLERLPAVSTFDVRRRIECWVTSPAPSLTGSAHFADLHRAVLHCSFLADSSRTVFLLRTRANKPLGNLDSAETRKRSLEVGTITSTPALLVMNSRSGEARRARSSTRRARRGHKGNHVGVLPTPMRSYT
jgi:hypothetical protein